MVENIRHTELTKKMATEMENILIELIKQWDFEKIDIFLRTNQDLELNSWYLTPLYYAIWIGRFDIADLLIDNWANFYYEWCRDFVEKIAVDWKLDQEKYDYIISKWVDLENLKQSIQWALHTRTNVLNETKKNLESALTAVNQLNNLLNS